MVAFAAQLNGLGDATAGQYPDNATLNRRDSMSALGQKQTCALQAGMSALLPKADICSAVAMSAMGN